MQVLEKDKIRLSYAHGEVLLHELVNGAFQYGVGADSQIITDPKQVAMFPEHVQARVQAWLERGGQYAAEQDKRAKLIAHRAEQQTGLLDQLVMAAGGDELKGELLDVITAFLKSKGTLPAKAPAEVQHLDKGGALVVDEHGNKEYVPPDMLEETLAREQQADEEEAAVLVAPSSAGQDSMTADMQTRKKPRRRS